MHEIPLQRVAAIHDLSGFGRASLTVVIPILASMGVQTCPLPTAVLSSQTSGVEGFTFHDLTAEMGPMLDHWQRMGLSFDAVYSGFLGNPLQLEIAARCIGHFLKPGGFALVDPVLGDNGTLDPTQTPEMVEAMRQLIAQADDNDNISILYVTDEDGMFYGAIDLKDLIIARAGESLESLISTSYPYVLASDSITDNLERLKDYAEDSIPVLDQEHHIIGVITAQDLVEAVDDEMGEDYAQLAGLTTEEDLDESVGQSMKKRLPWLLVLLCLGLGVSTVAGMFEKVMKQLTLIVFFQSVVLGMSGNSGTQSLAVTIRVLMDEELTGKERLKMVWKEARVGFCDGLLLGLVSFVCIGIYIMLAKAKPALYAFSVSGCVGTALMVAMTISSLVGTVVPIVLHKIHIDPAVASGPLISTVSDLVAVVTYYGLSWLLLLNIIGLTG